MLTHFFRIFHYETSFIYYIMLLNVYTSSQSLLGNQISTLTLYTRVFFHNRNNGRSLKLFRLSFKLHAVTFRIDICICKGGYIPRKPWHTCIVYTRLCKSTLRAHYKLWILRVWWSISESICHRLQTTRTALVMAHVAVADRWLSRSRPGKRRDEHAAKGHPANNNSVNVIKD